MMRLPVLAYLLAAATTAGADEIALSLESRTGLSIAVYNDGYAMVWDTRAASLGAGIDRLAFEGVSRQILPSSAIIVAGADVNLLDLVYDIGPLTQDALLRGSIGRTVGLVRHHPTTGEEAVESATLLSVAEKPIVNHRGRIEVADPNRLVFYEMPDDLRSQPTLLARVGSGESGLREITLGYSMRGLGWSADYIAFWNEHANQLQLTGRATLSNTSGTGFSEAELSLIAGSVNRQQGPQLPPAVLARAAPMMAEAQSLPGREQLADLHRYHVPGRVGLAAQQTKQITLFAPKPLAVNREYVSESSIASDRSAAGEPQATHPQVRLRFPNAPQDRSAGPMPAGVVRIYKVTDADRPPEFVGEDRIEHTPEGEAVTLRLGEAFDLTVLRRQTAFMQSGLPQGVSESSWMVEVKNAQNEPAIVRLVEVVPGEGTVLTESASHERETANRLVWPVQVPANGSAQLTYRIRVQQ